MRSTLVICLGNPLMRDEGIGTRLGSELSKRLADDSDVEVLDLGTGGLAVMHAITGRRRVVFVDCAIMGEAPGTIRCFTPDEVRSTRAQTRYSLHEGDLLNALELSRRMGECPDDIVILGIQPKEVTDGQGLTRDLENKIGEYVKTILGQISSKPKQNAEPLPPKERRRSKKH